MRYFNDFDLFLEAIKGEEKFISNRIKYNIPVNYEISESFIIFHAYDGKEFYTDYQKRKLYETLDKIATFTNVDLDCGCVFTMN